MLCRCHVSPCLQVELPTYIKALLRLDPEGCAAGTSSHHAGAKQATLDAAGQIFDSGPGSGPHQKAAQVPGQAIEDATIPAAPAIINWQQLEVCND